MSVRSAEEVSWDAEHDVVVVGTGAGGLVVGLTAAQRGADVVLLEKGEVAGGCMRKSGAAYWIPNNSYLRAAGLTDDREAALRYMARLAHPDRYTPDDPALGLAAWEFDGIAAFFDEAADTLDELVGSGAIRPLPVPDVPDYHALLPENERPYGRTMYTADEDGGMARGEQLTLGLLAAGTALGLPIRYEHRVDSVVVDGDEVVGVEAVRADGTRTALRARCGVVFATGGFTHDPALRRDFLPPAVLGGSAAPTNTGDFVPLAVALGAPLHNMANAWLAPIPFELALSGTPHLSGVFAVPGDSMLWVDRYGRRSTNEKAVYHESATSFLGYDADERDFPFRLRFMIWDRRSMDLWKLDVDGTDPNRTVLDNWGNPIYEGPHVLSGDTLAELATALRTRLADLAPHTGGFTLAPGFEQELQDSFARFNRYAVEGRDPEFRRGENPIEPVFHGGARPGNDFPNATMFPLSEEGPYYCMLLCAGTLDTKGGPRATPDGLVLRGDGEPIPGLYGVGNCVASPSGQAYWAAGGTLGPIFTAARRLGHYLGDRTTSQAATASARGAR